jgi:predicted ATP-dependent serine protease
MHSLEWKQSVIAGGGLVPGSAILVVAVQVAGKSTLLLQNFISSRRYPALYVTGGSPHSRLPERAMQLTA